jgi:ABC-type transport system involved in multi-copper enzyme maturation permease subunit
MMASQKLTNCCVAAIALAASTYVSTPHCSTIARLAFGAFCLAIDIDAFLRKHPLWAVLILKYGTRNSTI